MREEWEPYSGLAKLVYAAGFKYSPKNDIIYSRFDAAQRFFGYTQLYDDLAPVTISSIIDCEPIYFEFDGKQWMIEFWKGQYGIETGAEIGVYVIDSRFASVQAFSRIKRFLPTPYASLLQTVHPRKELLFFYSADDSQMLDMSFSLWRGARERLFDQGPIKHWWLTGFKWGEYSKPSALRMEWTIRFPSITMAGAFNNALKEKGYESTADDEGITISGFFKKPKTRQSPIRMGLSGLVMRRNKRMVDRYNELKRSEGIEENDPNRIEEQKLKTETARGAYRELSGFFETLCDNNQRLAMAWKEVD